MVTDAMRWQPRVPRRAFIDSEETNTAIVRDKHTRKCKMHVCFDVCPLSAADTFYGKKNLLLLTPLLLI